MTLEERAKQTAQETGYPIDREDIEDAYIAGVKFGLKQHSHDYLVKTKNLKKKYEKQLEQAKKYLEECVYNVVSPERLRKDIEQFLKELAE